MISNKCAWKKLSGDYCNQSCKGNYCAHHNHRLKTGAPGVIDSMICKNALKGRTPLCANSGGHQFRELARYYKHKHGTIITVNNYINGDLKKNKLNS